MGIDLLCSTALARGKRLLACLRWVSALFEDIRDRHINIGSLSSFALCFLSLAEEGGQKLPYEDRCLKIDFFLN